MAMPVVNSVFQCLFSGKIIKNCEISDYIHFVIKIRNESNFKENFTSTEFFTPFQPDLQRSSGGSWISISEIV